jgi:gliding motility-associated-like protein
MKFFRLLSVLFLLLAMHSNSFATHIRAGEITAVRVPGATLSYRFTLTVYTDSTSTVENPTATLHFGDGNQQEVTRNGDPRPILGNKTWINTYNFTHTYSASRTYTVYYFEANRNENVLNMSNSDQVSFYIETQLTIDPSLPPNNSPVLTVPPVDLACTNRIWYHNPGATDTDGDSLSYEFVACRTWSEASGRAVNCPDFVQPETVFPGLNFTGTGPATLTIDRRGNIKWNTPAKIGQYNLAFKITEWRTIRGRKIAIGFVIRDMQIIVSDCRNLPPILTNISDTCIEATTTLVDTIVGTDPNVGDRVTIQAFGGPAFPGVGTNVANFPTVTGIPPKAAVLTWPTACTDVQEQPYALTYKIEDIPVTALKMSEFVTQEIYVNGPKPKGMLAVPDNQRVQISWNNYINTVCPNASSIQIYRRTDSSRFVDSKCTPGIPRGFRYELIATVPASQDTYTDDDKGKLLQPGKEYCYRLVATFPSPKGGLSYASDEFCTVLQIEMPVITKVSVTKTGIDTGQVEVKWIPARDIDTLAYPKPYQYRLLRTEVGSNLSAAEVFRSNNLADTTFTESNLNTAEKEYKYQLLFYYSPRTTLKDSTDPANTIVVKDFPNADSIKLTWNAKVPWNNFEQYHYIYRRQNGPFELIDSVFVADVEIDPSYVDKGTFKNEPLIIGRWYEYYITTQGQYGDEKLPRPLLNNSPIIRTQLRDSTLPCPPTLTVTSPPCTDCKSFNNLPKPIYNLLSWTKPVAPCDSEVVRYNIYYAQYEEETPQKIGETIDTFFNHSNAGSLAGCYYVTAVDFSGNESEPSNKVCIDNCVSFELPNVFTPNGDEYNAVMKPFCYVADFINQVDFRVFNRYGVEVFRGKTEKNIGWNGKTTGGNELAEGMYYYQVEVDWKRVRKADSKQTYNGWVMIIR